MFAIFLILNKFCIDEILLEMSGHPPFLFPQDYGVIDLAHPPDDKEFWTHFKKLYTQYGVIEGSSITVFSRYTLVVKSYNLPLFISS